MHFAYILIFLLILAIGSAFLGLIFAQAILGSIYVLFVPGFFITYAMFPKKEIDKLERIILSIALSISIVPVIILMTNIMFEFLIRITTIFLYIAIISSISLFVYFHRTDKNLNSVISLAAALFMTLVIIFLSEQILHIRFFIAIAGTIAFFTWMFFMRHKKHTKGK